MDKDRLKAVIKSAIIDAMKSGGQSPDARNAGGAGEGSSAQSVDAREAGAVAGEEVVDSGVSGQGNTTPKDVIGKMLEAVVEAGQDAGSSSAIDEAERMLGKTANVPREAVDNVVQAIAGKNNS
mgnify:FL=1